MLQSGSWAKSKNAISFGASGVNYTNIKNIKFVVESLLGKTNLFVDYYSHEKNDSELLNHIKFHQSRMGNTEFDEVMVYLPQVFSSSDSQKFKDRD